MPLGNGNAELVHGKDGHRMRRIVRISKTLLRSPHLIGEWTAARHDDQRKGCARQKIDPALHFRMARRAASELDDDAAS